MKVRVRMYRAGLGDCFLLTFDPGGAAIHVMIDCGVLLSTDDAAARIGTCVDDIIAATDNHVHVVVATHEHWDHVSGFHQAWDKLKDLVIDQVWFAWTEDPDDETATRLRRDRAQRRAQLAAAASLWSTMVTGGADGDPSSAATQLAMTREVLAFHGPFGEPNPAVLGAASTSGALDRLRVERGDRAEYLEPGTHRPLPGLPGVGVYVLGPPRDERLLRKGRPSTRIPETYGDTTPTLAATFFDSVAAARGVAPPLGMLTRPFDAVLLHPVPDPASQVTGADSFFIEHYLRGESYRKIDGDWLAVTTDLALALDNDTNNTSLVLAFEIGDGGDVLLFPADAQVGNWQSWDELVFDVGSGTSRRIVTSDELLGRTTLYKVGHHGSHNATLRAGGLEKMTSPDLVAMISVERTMANRLGWAMPFPPLHARLLEKCCGRVLFLDEDRPDGRRMRRMSRAEAEAFLARVTTTKTYVELRLG
ncbi:MAG: MBL fold metallo-hydrolase [Deltaproteobacteria bacterium]|nr:MAG: MBL fold metallo-hydrolase [Deltaproteobacteria bacterium]TMQ24736.1 MAG: MBL fold metallo-hydrolase [Deltaproteobacteria bacterium]